VAVAMRDAGKDAGVPRSVRDLVAGLERRDGLLSVYVDRKGGRVLGVINSVGSTIARECGRGVYLHAGPEVSVVSTKTFTCTLLSDLVLHDGLALSDPVQRYLPEDVVMPTRSGNVITLQHLATHTSGLPFLPTNMEVGNAVSAFADYTVTDQYDFLANYRLPRDPGTQWEYSDLGVGLLGHVLARQTGNDYESLVKDRIARVLDMPDTRITLTPDQQRRRVRGYAGVAARQYMTCPVLPGCVALRSIGFHLLEPSSPLDTDPVPAAIPLENVQGCVGRYYLNANDFFALTLQQGPLTFVHSSDPSLPFTLYPSSP